jgi:hypothetical protein
MSLMDMKRNVGSTDKALRMVIGVAMIAIGYTYQNTLWIFGIPILVTGIIGWCPFYAFFGKSTHEK